MPNPDNSERRPASDPGAPRPNARPEGDASPRRSVPRRIASFLLVGTAAVLGLVVLLFVAILIVMQLDWGRERVKHELVTRVSAMLVDAELQVERISGNVITGLALYDVHLVHASGARLGHIDTLRADYRLLPLLRGRVKLTDIYIGQPSFWMTMQRDSSWDLLSILPVDTTAADTARSIRIDLDHLDLRNGRLEARYYTPGRDSIFHVEDLQLALGRTSFGNALVLQLDTISATVRPPGRTSEPVRLAAGGSFDRDELRITNLKLQSPRSNVAGRGTLHVPSKENDHGREMDFRLTAHPLVMGDLHPFLPQVNPDDSLLMDVRIYGSPSAVQADVDARLSDGGVVDLKAAYAPPGEEAAFYKASGSVRSLDPSFFTGDPAHAGRVNAEVDVDLEGRAPEHLHGHANLVLTNARVGEFTSDRTAIESTFTNGEAAVRLASTFGSGTIDVDGTIRPFDEQPVYDLTGRVDRLNVAHFSGDGTASSRLSGSFAVQGRGVDARTAEARFDFHIEPSSYETYRIQSARLQGSVDSGNASLSAMLRAPEGLVSMKAEILLGDEMTYRIRDGVVRDLDVAALTGDTTRTSINATFGAEGRGSDPETMEVSGQLTVYDSYFEPIQIDRAALSVAMRNGRIGFVTEADLGPGGRIDASGAARPFDDVLSFEISRAQFRNVDVGALSGNVEQESDLNGSLVMRARGSDPAGLYLDGRLRLTPSRVNEQVIDAADVDATVRRGLLNVDGEARFPEGVIAVRGSARPFDPVPSFTLAEGRFAGLDLGALTGRPDLATNLNGVLQAEGSGTTLETASADLTLDVEPSTVGETTIERGRLEGDLREGIATLDLSGEAAGGTIVAAGRLDAAREEPTYAFTARVQQLHVPAADTAGARLSVAADLEGRGFEPATMHLEGRLFASEGRFADVRLDSLDTRFMLSDGHLQIDTLLLRSNVADARAGGSVALFDTLSNRTSDFHLTADVTSLQPLRSFVAAEVFSLRDARIEVALSGPARQLEVEADVLLNSLIYNDVRVAGLEAAINGTLGPDRTLRRADVVADVNYVSTADATVRQTHAEVDYEGHEAVVVVESLVDERREGRLAARLDLRPERRHVLIEDMDMRVDDDEWTLVEPATIAYGNGYRISPLVLTSGEQRIAAEGVIDSSGTHDFRLDVDALRLGGFADLVGLDRLGGTLDLQADLSGASNAPVLDAQLGVLILDRNNPAGRIDLDVSYADARAQIDGSLVHAEGSILTLTGTVPVSPDSAAEAAGPVDLRVQSTGFSIDMLRPFLPPDAVDDLEGTLRADVQVGGAVHAPELDGTFGLTEGRIRIRSAGIDYDPIRLTGTLASNTIVLEAADVRSGGGRLLVSGQIELPDLTLGQFELDAEMNDFRALNSDLYRVTTSGNLSVTGTTDEPVVSGSVQVHDSDLYLDRMASGAGDEVRLTETDRRMLEEYFGYRIAEADTATSTTYENLTLDLDVELERDTWIRQTANPEVTIEITGRVDVQKQPQEEIQVFRTLEVIPQRSYVRQFGRRFNLAHGTVTFNGPVEELIVDAEAHYTVPSRMNPGQPEAVIILSLEGRPDDLEFALSSDPPMDNTDIVAYIASGRPAGSALAFGGDGGGGGDFDLLTAGGGLAANQLAGVFEGLAGEELGLDVIEIHQDGLRGTQLVAGKYVSPKVYVGINQSVSLVGTETPTGTAPTEVTVEYELFEWLLVQLLSSTSSSSVRINLMGKHAFN